MTSGSSVVRNSRAFDSQNASAISSIAGSIGVSLEELLGGLFEIGVGIARQPLALGLGAFLGRADQRARRVEQFGIAAGLEFEQAVRVEQAALHLVDRGDLGPRIADLGGERRVGGNAGAQIALGGAQAHRQSRRGKRGAFAPVALVAVLDVGKQRRRHARLVGARARRT